MKKYLQLIGSVLLYSLIYVIPNALAGIILVFMIAVSNIEQAQNPIYIQQMVNKYIFLVTFFALIVSALILVRLLKFNKKSIIEYCNFSFVNFKVVGLLILLGFLSNLFLNSIFAFIKNNETLMNLLGARKEFFDIGESAKVMMNGNILIVVLVIGILTPVFEEILYRGVIFNRLNEDVKVETAIILQAIVFALCHFNMIQGMYTFVLGVLLALCYHWLKSIWVPIIVHMSFNTSNILMKFIILKITNIFDMLLPLIMTLALVSISFILYYIKNRKEMLSNENVKTNLQLQ
ncbi:CPBP family intramembrane glutamic endopeptidase [Caldisalinibacter kiritimatiensis]|uniref:CAAX prenyl protease 2/Lysostaphin resistance protein A-like domain-containing protein n=1 Tax=Caldisalinibacter kiritimatiensis TaxID=1304284 RepID=R1AY30_9FIRM|nr:type II CAAX endopeptidase family protein [Caldisalinibacter kiritimatiensis]EOD01567.1 hypothetical protein L21TH_0370 [Caldisalinibacter kiritimatiensis]